MQKNRRYIEINGIVEVSPDIDGDTFTDMFLGWIESNGWYFGSGIGEVNEEGEPIG
jgi:hypothetical protein